jgi:hypothetical protein
MDLVEQSAHSGVRCNHVVMVWHNVTEMRLRSADFGDCNDILTLAIALQLTSRGFKALEEVERHMHDFDSPALPTTALVLCCNLILQSFPSTKL